MHRRIALVVAFVAANLMACCCGGFGRQTPPNQDAVANGGQDDKTQKHLTPDQPAVIGNVRLRLLVGKIERITYFDKTFKEVLERKDGPQLRIIVSIENTSKDKIESYSPWSKLSLTADKIRATVKDEHGNTYKLTLQTMIGMVPIGQLDEVTRIDPGRKIEDVLVFERPLDSAKEFTLELPGGNIGRRGEKAVYRFQRTWLEK